MITLNPELLREQHYRDLFLTTGDRSEEFESLLPFLPEPVTLDHILSELRHNLVAFPDAMLGEVGLDRSFRVALDYHASPRDLTKFTIPLHHQLAVLEAQLDVAVDLARNVSFHSVKSQMITMELLARMSQKYGDRWNKISIDMHSCGFSSQTWKTIEVHCPPRFPPYIDISSPPENVSKCFPISFNRRQWPVCELQVADSHLFALSHPGRVRYQ